MRIVRKTARFFALLGALQLPAAACLAGALFDTYQRYSGTDTINGGEPFAAEMIAESKASGAHFTKARRLLHQKILEKFLREGKPADAPRALFTAGAPGSGKSAALDVLKRNGLPLDDYLVIDPDRIRAELPEYLAFTRENPTLAAERTQEEASYLAKLLIRRAVHERKNIVVDTSFATPKYYDVFKAEEATRGLRYRRTLLTVDAAPEVLRQRIHERALQTGRGMSNDVFEEFRSALRNMESTFNSTESFDEIFRVDTTRGTRLKGYYGPGSRGERRVKPVDEDLGEYVRRSGTRTGGCAGFFEALRPR